MARNPFSAWFARLAAAGLLVAIAACTPTPESTKPPSAPPSPVANEAPGGGAQPEAFDASDCRAPQATTGPLVVRGGPGGACTLITGDSVYKYDFVNVADGGTLFFQDDGRAIDFRAKSVLVEMGGTVRAGSWNEPFGANGGSLTIGLWGDDPTAEGTTPATEPGIRCIGGQGETGCYPDDRIGRFCLGADADDPCNAREGGAVGDNARFEGYRDLEYDEGFFGYKVLAVGYGGRIELFGQRGVAPSVTDPTVLVERRTCALPGPAIAAADATGSSWARLAAPIGPGSTRLELDHAVNWTEGDEVVLSTTDWYPSHSEVVTVASNERGIITLKAPPRYAHRGEVYTMPAQAMASTGNPNTSVDVRGAAGLLTRSITIRSLGRTADEPFPAASACGLDAGDPSCYFGGHVIVRQGFGAVHVQGVNFHQLGQGGRMGHYPLHFHLNKSTRYTNAFVTDSSITESHNRFVVLHGTHDVTLARNVGYLSVGHGFYLEDGSEINNLLCYNLGISARGALREYYAAQPADSPTHRAVPPILDQIQGTSPRTAGSDGHMPVMFWIMNAFNEFVGNKAVGVMGAGSCYWLLGSGVSGMSAPAGMAGMAGIGWTSGTNTDQDYASFNRAGARQAPLKRFRANSCVTAAYALQTTIDVEPTLPGNTGYHALANPYLAAKDIMRPVVSGNFNPTRVDDPALAELPGPPEPNCRQGIATGDTWTLNVPSCSGTVIDHFTTSFNWAEVGFGSVWLRPWWYVFVNSAITDQLFGGLGFVTGGSWAQVPPGNLQIARDSLFVGTTSGGDPASYHGPDVTQAVRSGPALTLPSEGIGYPTGSLNPQRLMTIYDGPFYSDGSAFAAVAPFDCPEGDLARCGVYTYTMQPKRAGTPPRMTVINAAVGWKQQNGFYYPPAFAFRRSGFDATSFRHNTFDQYAPYAGGDPFGLVTSIDFSTILNDVDGTFTGVVSSRGARTASVSRNKFFDAPSQDDECLSFGVQTSPYDFVTTAMAKLKGDGPWTVDWQAWNTPTVNPAVPIYRQLKLVSDVCDGDTTCGCWRASFLMGGQNGEAPYLTADRGVYYIDTTMTSKPSCQAGENRLLPANSHLAPFRDGETYVLYHLFARPDTRVTYQFFVGDGFRPTDGRWVRVQPHVFSGEGNNLVVTRDDDIAAPLPAATDGVLTVTLDNAQIESAFTFKARAGDEKCHPRDLCQIAADGGRCTIADGYAESDLADTIRSICEEWATATAGVSDTMDGLTLADCPEGGCLGYAFTLPNGFEAVRAAHPYSVAGAPLATWFPDNADWNVPMRLLPGDNPCPAPPTPNGFDGQ